MGILDSFKRLFSKKIYLSSDDIQKFYVATPKLKKRIPVNSVIVVPEGSVCVACVENKPCDLLNPGEFVLNGASLPQTFKRGDYNKLKKNGRTSSYFGVQLYCISDAICPIEFDVGKFTIKDHYYGKQKVDISISLKFKCVEPMKFFKILLHEKPNIRKERVLPTLISWFSYDIITFFKKRRTTIDEFMHYTTEINNQLIEILTKRFQGIGIHINEFYVEDIILPEKLVRDITENRKLSLEIHSQIETFEACMNEDGVYEPVEFVRSEEQTKDSILDRNYANIPTQNPNIDDDDYGQVVLNSAQTEYDLEMEELEKSIVHEENRQVTEEQSKQTNKVTTKFCTNCHKQVPDYALFCPYCASAITLGEKTCPNCFAINSSDAIYCCKCATKLEE